MATDLDADRTEPDLEDGQGSAGSEAIRLERNAKVELAREGGHRVRPRAGDISPSTSSYLT